MAYSTGMLRHRVIIQNKVSTLGFGDTTEYEDTAVVWSDVTWLKGVKRLAESALDAQDTVMIRMRWNQFVTRNSRLKCDGVVYQIQSLHADRQENTIQITATEVVLAAPTYTPSMSTISGGPRNPQEFGG